MARDAGFAYDSWGSTAVVDTGPELDFAAGDVLVMPETGGSKWSFLSDGHPVVVLCQGMDFVFAHSDFLTDEPGAYPGWPHATAALTVSDAIRTFLGAACPPAFRSQRSSADRGLVPAGREATTDCADAATPARGPARSRPARSRSGRLGDWESS